MTNRPAPSPIRTAGYWSEATAGFVKGEGEGAHSDGGAWRRHCDHLHRELLASWIDPQSSNCALKTDLFDEMAGLGLIDDMERYSRTVHGLDVSVDVAASAVRSGSGVLATAADVRQLPYRDGAFELVVSNSTLDHFAHRRDIVAALAEIHRVTASGATVVVTLDNLANPIIALRSILPFRLLRAIGLVPYYVGATTTRRGLARMLSAAGFQVEVTTTFMHVPRVVAVPWCARSDSRSDGRSNPDRERLLGRLLSWERLRQAPHPRPHRALRRRQGQAAVTAPNFFVVGAGRSGTTSLHEILGQHPDVFMCPRKSPNYFAAHLAQPGWETPVATAMARHWVHDADEYRALFDGATTQRAVGEVSPVYLQALDVAPRIDSEHPDASIVAVLRNPVDRAHSHFVGRRRDGIEIYSTFAERAERELAAPLPDDVAFGHLIGCGRYHHFLRPYVELFGADRVTVVLYDDFVADARAVVAEIFEAIGVDVDFVPELSARSNRTGIIRNGPARAVWTRTVRVRTALRPHLPDRLRAMVGRPFLAELDKPELDQRLRQRLGDVVRDDVAALEVLLDRDLSRWQLG